MKASHGTTGYDRSRYKNRSLPVSEHLELAMLLLFSRFTSCSMCARRCYVAVCEFVCAAIFFCLFEFESASEGSASTVPIELRITCHLHWIRLDEGSFTAHTVVSSFFSSSRLSLFFVRSRYRLLCSLHFIRIHLTIYSTK